MGAVKEVYSEVVELEEHLLELRVFRLWGEGFHFGDLRKRVLGWKWMRR